MYKQSQIFFVCIFAIFMATANNISLTNDNDIELNLEHLQPIENNSPPNVEQRVDSLSLLQLLKRDRRSFTTDQTKYQQQMLQSHNTYRARHCVASLQLDDALSHSAQNYANTLAKMNKMEHSGTTGVGENLWMMRSSVKLNNIDGGTATASWYNEIQKYDFNRPGFTMETGHFTQVVWKNTKKLGVGFAFTSDRKAAYVVAQYSPPGNYQGQFPNNVLPAKC